MKNYRNISLSIMAMLFSLISFTANAQDKTSKFEEVTLQTSAVCEMCKESIEKALNFEKGVKIAVLDLETKKVKVTYRPDKTNVENIVKAINKLGYDAGESMADPKSYQNLHSCCKKDSH